MSGHDPRDDYDDAPEWGPAAPPHTGRGVASVMWVFGLMQLIGTQVWVAFVLTVLIISHFVDGDETLAEAWNSVTTFAVYWVTLLCWPIASACSVLVMIGANSLRQFRRYSLAVCASALLILSVPFVCLAVPQTIVGIYALCLLLRRDVRARFEAVARGTIPSSQPEHSDARIDRDS